MEIRSTDLISLFEKSLNGAPQQDLQEIGFVIKVGDGICKVYGLNNAIYNELINFDGGNQGIIFDLEQYSVTIFLLHNTIPTVELETAKRTGNVFRIPVGNELLGRTINAMGQPIDGLGDISTKIFHSIERAAPGIIERSPINESLETGIMAIDALIPIGKGQRELIIGNRNTGKTALAIDTILHQHNKNVICIYVSIGQRQANLARIIQLLVENDALKYTIIVSADSSDSVLTQYLAPYAGCTIGEYFRDNGQDALIIYDDLSNHAIAYREMSLLMKRPAGREAYPGDVFYLHSRLLERAGKTISNGSLTALPIIQVQADDITAYIPTNLISITDGQIFLDDQLFKNGTKPAVNIGLSVSRVGGAAQTKAIKKMTKSLGLELAQYRELADFSQFGTELDKDAQKRLSHGERAVQLLKQQQYVTYSFVQQSLMLFLLQTGFFDKLPITQVNSFALQFVSYVESVYTDLYNTIQVTADITDNQKNNLKEIAQEIITLFTEQE